MDPIPLKDVIMSAPEVGAESSTPNLLSDMASSPGDSDVEWIAIEPPPHSFEASRVNANSERLDAPSPGDPNHLPSFDESQFAIVLRRQRMRPIHGGGVKLANVPSRFLNLSNDFEFAGWGSITRLELTDNDCRHGQKMFDETSAEKTLGKYTAAALAGNDLLGGVFYTLPAVFSVAGVYSPISLLIATSLLFMWRPIMEELAAALPLSGASYTYMLNFSTKSLAMVSASLLLLDFASTAVVSSATAAAYLAGEVALPFPSFICAVLVLVIFAAISLCGIRESARVAFTVLTLHIVVMGVLMVASVVAWGRVGNEVLRQNWQSGQHFSPRSVLRSVYDGICLGMLGLTGFECTPAYIARIKPGRFPSVLRNLHYPAIVFNVVPALLVLALLPLNTISGDANLLSTLGEMVAGRWLRILLVIDAVVVLCGGVLTGILSACELLEQLACDRVIPQVFLRTMPVTKSPYISVISFVAFSGCVYASTGASLSIVSDMFCIVWLAVMALFPLSLLLLKFNRGRLPRERHTCLGLVLATLAVCPVIFAGNVAINPVTVAFFLAYFSAVLIFFVLALRKVRVLRCIYWVYDQSPILHKLRLMRKWGEDLISAMRTLRRQPVCVLVKTDEINHLFQMVLYVRQSEPTACLKLVHFTDAKGTVPSELEANAKSVSLVLSWHPYIHEVKVLDEAFPEITIDLVIVNSSFNPVHVAALAHRLQIPRSLMFMTCPGSNLEFSVAELGIRIITM